MASPGELTKTVAETLGLDPTTVANIYRGLREAGLVTKGGRGRSAATITPRDAAMLLIGICASDTVKDAAISAKEYCELRPIAGDYWDWADDHSKDRPAAAGSRWRLTDFGLDNLAALPAQHHAVDAISGFLDAFANPVAGTLLPEIKDLQIDFHFAWPSPFIEVIVQATSKDEKRYVESIFYADGATGQTIERTNSELQAKGRDATRPISGDLKVVRSFGIATLSRLGELIRAK